MKEVVEATRRWVGTPYVHQGRRRGAGCDCLGLVLGVWRDLGGTGPAVVPPYSPDWAETEDAEDLFVAARRFLVPVSSTRFEAGRIILLRMRRRGPAKHLGIVTESGLRPRFVHSYWGRGVVESSLSAPWRRHVVAQFQFPNEAD